MHEYGEADALRAAEASTERYRAGVPRGGLDGVPIVIKEEMAVAGFRRQAGTRCLDGRVHTADGTLVEHLKAAGAIVLGTTTMTELGFFPLGVNPHRVMPRNPHHLGHGAGGSSTGTGVAVATGLVPFGIGCDGGGSIRIPASSCGVFGLKPTWGRISRFGEPTPGTVEHYGPLATSPLDLARCVEVASGADPNDPETLRAPPLARGTLVGALARGVAGLRIGILDSEWEDADREVAAAGRAAVDALVREGATLVSLQSDLLHVAPAVGYLVLPMGARLVLDDVYTQSPEQLGADLYVSLTALNRVRAIDYLLAAQLRVGLRLEMQRLFREVDVIVLPTTKSVAPALSDEDFEGGVLDAAATHSQCRYTFLSNLTGHPAATAPVGKSASGLPIGLQVIGDAWDEATVLSVLAHLERMEVARVERPMVHVDPLGVA
jgi:aspartyl-tRNA(Asn)/glutamyl-tRNA(Gln) amidotransferase subunit A